MLKGIFVCVLKSKDVNNIEAYDSSKLTVKLGYSHNETPPAL